MLRPLARLLFALLTVVSLLLCVAASTFWIRSYWVEDRYKSMTITATGGITWSVGSAGGQVLINHSWKSTSASQGSSVPYSRWSTWPTESGGPVRGRTFWERRGFAYDCKVAAPIGTGAIAAFAGTS